MIFSRTYDRQYIKKCLTDPCVWRMSVDDSMSHVNPKLYFIPPNLNIYYLSIDPGYGLLMGVPLKDKTYEAHVALLPKARGKASELCSGAIKWFFEHEECDRVVANIPSYNKLAIRLAEKVGMQNKGAGVESFKRDGELYDIIFFEIKQEDICHQ